MWVLILGCSLDNLLVNTNVIIPNINNEMLNGYQIYLVFLIWSIVTTPPKNIENIDIIAVVNATLLIALLLNSYINIFKLYYLNFYCISHIKNKHLLSASF